MSPRDLALGVHIAAGGVGLLAAPVAMLTAKGGKLHRRAGNVFYWCMAVVAASAMTLVLFFGSSTFLFFIAILSFYLAFNGVRAPRRKLPAKQPAGWLDWAAAGIALSGAAGLFVVAAAPQVFRIPGRAPTIPLAFGLVLLLTAGTQVRDFVRPASEKNRWWFKHMTGMLAAYIAFVTAFSAVNFGFLPPVVRWLWPTAIGTPLIALWVRAYRKRFASKTALSAP